MHRRRSGTESGYTVGYSNTMINYNSNISVVVGARLAQLKELQANPDPILRTVALTILPELKHRVHIEGKDSNGEQIGTYSESYMQVRTGNYKNSDRFTRGDKKGLNKNAGTFTDRKITLDKKTGVFSGEDKVGTARPNYQRSSDPKVILSLTRQMENDLSVIDTPTGYGIGYLNPFNMEKAMNCEKIYKKPILSKLTTGELDLAKSTAENFTPEYLKQFQ